jgi:2,3-bisphosphoglycerate-independent phosphoglycerate mutase
MAPPHTSHLRGLIDATQEYGLKDVFVHASQMDAM